MIRNRTFRYVTLGLIGLYVVIPMYATVQFSLEGGNHGQLSFDAYRQALAQPGLGSSIVTSIEVSFGAMAITLVLLVPTIIYVNLRLPRWRPWLEAFSLLPLGVPSVVIVVGVLGVYNSLPNWIIVSPVILALLYVILALPYSYRAIDAGVRSIDLHTLVEAGRSMGAGWGRLFFRVLFPNLRSGILAASFLVVALSLGEYAIANLILPTTPTFPVFLAGVETVGVYLSVALSVIALVVTWGLLAGVSVLGSGRRRSSGAAVEPEEPELQIADIAARARPAHSHDQAPGGPMTTAETGMTEAARTVPTAQQVQRRAAGAGLDLVGCRRDFDKVRALDGFSISIAPGELVALLGPSGCGKTTALRAVAGLEQLDEGKVLVGGEDITGLPAHKRNLGMVFQAYSLFPNMNALDNVAFGLEVRKVPAARRRQRAGEMLDLVRLTGLGGRFPHEMSGGQQQRVALARALCAEPRLLLLDEPLSALDAKVRHQLREEIRRIQLEFGITTLFVTHDQEEALSMSDRVGVMRAGRLEQLGPPAEVYSSPTTEFVAQFVGSVSRLPGEITAPGVVELLGRHVAVTRGTGADLPVGSPVDVLVRPESIRIAPDPRGPAVVARASFLGAFVRVVAVLADGTEVASTLPASEGTSLPAGASVDVELLDEALFVVPRPPAP